MLCNLAGKRCSIKIGKIEYQDELNNKLKYLFMN